MIEIFTVVHVFCVSPSSDSFKQGASPLVFPCLEYFSGRSTEASGSQCLFLRFCNKLDSYGDSMTSWKQKEKGWAFEKSKERETEGFSLQKGKGQSVSSGGKGGDRFHA